jgi:hypothetical protein
MDSWSYVFDEVIDLCIKKKSETTLKFLLKRKKKFFVVSKITALLSY